MELLIGIIVMLVILPFMVKYKAPEHECNFSGMSVYYEQEELKKCKTCNMHESVGSVN